MVRMAVLSALSALSGENGCLWSDTVQNEGKGCPEWGSPQLRELKVESGKREKYGTGKHHVQRFSNSSEWLLKAKKRISLCLCASVVKYCPK